MAIWKAWVLTPRVLVNGSWQMQLALDYPTGGPYTDVSSQLDADAHQLPLCVVLGIAPTDAALATVKANANHLVLAQIQVDDLNGDQETVPRNTTLDDPVTGPQITAFTNYLTAHGIDITKYNLNLDLAVGKTRRQVLQAIQAKLQRRLA